MDEPLAVALKFGFLAVLYLFLLWVSRSALRDLARSQEPVMADPVEAPRHGGAPAAGGLQHVNPRLEVIAALGHEPGTRFDIAHGATLGRGENADIRVEDGFASSAHAQLFQRDDFMFVEDMGSTNGTYLNGRQLVTAQRLKVGDVIRIGDSEYRYDE
jgi:hypothetical protein